MRMLLLYILLALLGQQTTVNGQQTPFLESENLKTSESEKGCEPRAMSHETFLESENLKTSKSEKGSEQRAMSHEQRFRKAQSSQLEAQSLKKTVDCCPLTVDYFENQIRLADSLYKNYLPQYNFDEVKAAMMFFDSCEQRAMSNETFLETENLKTSKSEKVQKDSQVFNFSVSQILYYENQIRLADSLYKNYLPQYNFEEVKAAVMFFDSLRLTTANGQQTFF